MQLNRSKILLACTLATSMMFSACSNADNSAAKTDPNQKKQLIQTLEKNLKTANINAKINDVKATEVPNLYWVSLEDMSPVYVTSDGQYLIQGDVVRLGGTQLINISDQLQATENKKLLATLNLKDLLVYPAKGATKQVVYIFTDANCPYCHKLHAEIPALNAKGIEVRYIAWPRGEQFMPTMESIWCSDNRQAAFDQAIANVDLPTATCKNPVSDQYQLGLKMGVNGTPAIYNVDGEYLGGYMSADDLIKKLEK